MVQATQEKTAFEEKVGTAKAAELLGMSGENGTRFVTRLIHAGHLRAYKMAGRKWLVAVASIEEYLESVRNT